VENNQAQVIAENSKDSTDIDCNPNEYINFGHPEDNDAPNLENYTTETFFMFPGRKAQQLRLHLQ
jgi:hypothetical protein